MTGAVLWSLVGSGVLVLGVGGFFLGRLLTRRAFESKVRELFESGQFDLAVDRLVGRGRAPEAAERLVKWGKRDKAAQIYVRLDDWVNAARLHEEARQYGTAAVYHLKAGNKEQAARCYARHGRAQKAADLYRELGQNERAAELLKESGDFSAAAELERETAGEETAVRTLVEGGRVEEAAKILLDGGDEEAANTLLAEHFDETGQWARAGEAYEALGKPDEAAERFTKAGDPLRAGELYEQAGKLQDAVEQYDKARAFDRAARCLDALGDGREAGRHYLLAGMMSEAIESLEAAGDVVSVAQLHRQSGFSDKAIAVLDVPAGHEQYRQAHVLRARLMESNGDLDGARNELISLVTRLGLSQNTIDIVYMIAELYAQQGDAANAIRILERSKARGLRHKDLDRRLDELKAALEMAKAAPAGTPQISLAGALPQNDRYEFDKKLGQGGMGSVYKAKDKKLGRTVAIKLLLDSDLPSDMAKKYFFREAQTVSVLNHPNIVALYDFGEMDERPFIAMEYVDGRNLEQMVKKRPTLPLDLMLDVCTQLSRALDYAHSKKIIHRDIKLGNVMVTREGAVKLMDFGLAKAITENPDRSLLVIGTPYYMAPEQIAHEDIDHRVDIYALGILMYRLVTGHLPFETGDVLRAQRFEAPPDPLTFAPKLPRTLVGLILHCLEKRPEDRPETAGEIADRLQSIAVG